MGIGLGINFVVMKILSKHAVSIVFTQIFKRKNVLHDLNSIQLNSTIFINPKVKLNVVIF